MANYQFEILGLTLKISLSADLESAETNPESLVENEEVILKILDNNWPREMRGLEIVEQSRGVLTRASIYFWLSMLEESGLVVSRVDDTVKLGGKGHIRPRLYKLTDDGYHIWQKLCSARATGL